MELINELLQNLNTYLDSLNHSQNWLEFVAVTICPIVTTLAVVVGGCFALIKYRQSKNYDINLKILNEVYVPLYCYLVKQETFRYILAPDSSWEENPILEITSTTTIRRLNSAGFSQEETKETIFGCSREKLLELNRETNMGLASTELISLMNAYEVLVHMTSGNLITPGKAKAVILQQKVEIALRKEILRGYKHYHSKLGLYNKKSSVFKTTDEQIEFVDTISQEEIEREMRELNEMQENLRE